jgi:hypothetical protein
MKFKQHLNLAVFSPTSFTQKALLKTQRKFRAVLQRRRDAKYSTYLKPPLFLNSKLYKSIHHSLPFHPFSLDVERISALGNHYLSHRFDLLGSGWLQIKHGVRCQGLQEFHYPMGLTIRVDSEGLWLKDKINQPNLSESQRIWRLLPVGYTPIDWHLDFKSGFRWSEKIGYLDIPYGHKPGVDIKVPWELSRMQHLPQFVWAYFLAMEGVEGFHPPRVYLQEFRNQVLDFIATNPPRFGVNWTCTMDVAIRMSNWLVTYDLFRAYGAKFDNEFEKIFIRSIYEHGLHIVNNLEWDPIFRGNHYLADIVGLLFVAAYLPRSSETDAWLAFAVQELIKEVKLQFNPDGTNFEASTSYHRLSAEMVVYATALVLGLPFEKQEALKKYDHCLIKGKPRLKAGPIPFYHLQGSDRLTPFPHWYIERLEKMAEVTMYITREDEHIPQIGDNDSGRFLKLQPVFNPITVSKAKARYNNLKGYTDLPDDTTYWNEDHLDHRPLVAAMNGLFDRDDFSSFTGGGWIETHLIKQLSGNVHLPSSVKKNPSPRPSHGSDDKDITLNAFPDFGLYIYRTKRIYLAVRCGPIGQKGKGGHAHNDQLSFELSVGGISFIVDPGTYLYTPLPEKRNLFRSTMMHNTLAIDGKEQNFWREGSQGIFGMNNSSKANVVECNTNRFIGEHRGFGAIHRRTLEFLNGVLYGVDEIQVRGSKNLFFHLAPEIKIEITEYPGKIDLVHKDCRLSLQAHSGTLSIKDSLYSRAYGTVESSQAIQLMSSDNRIEWSIQLK